MPARLWARSMLVISILFAMLFAVGMVVFTALELYFFDAPLIWETVLIFSLIFAIGLIGLQFLIAPVIMDFMLRWVYKAHWVNINELPPYLQKAIPDLQQHYRFNWSRIAIIEDLNPNAFTYGRFRRNARLALTQGIFHFLEEDEVKAVVAHEAGHVRNRDFFWMTVASAVPIICYVIFRSIASARFFRASGGSGKSKGQAAAILLLVAVVSFLVYYFSQYVVLYLSRVREYYADQFSALATEKPGALSRALVKIAYGMVSVQAKESQTEEQEGALRVNAFRMGIRAMGIFDTKAATSLALGAASRGMEYNSENVAAVASWDLSNPWASFIQLQSTHPLPARRMLALNRLQEEKGIQPEFPDLGKVKPPESLWDEFFIDLFVEYIPTLLLFGLILLPILGFIPFAFLPTYLPTYFGFLTNLKYLPTLFLSEGIGFTLLAVLWFFRKRIKYPKIRLGMPTDQVIQAVEREYEASPVRGKAVKFEGKLIGRGIPGFMFSEDLVIQDASGIITIDYNSPLGFLNFFFGWLKAPHYLGRKATVYGWLRRRPHPVLSLWRLEVERDVVKNRWSGWNKLVVIIFLGIGIIFLLLGGFLTPILQALGLDWLLALWPF
ncbi:MAG: M48 family metalloprotease [Candidatus Hermodarchaeota archaeon]